YEPGFCPPLFSSLAKPFTQQQQQRRRTPTGLTACPSPADSAFSLLQRQNASKAPIPPLLGAIRRPEQMRNHALSSPSHTATAHTSPSASQRSSWADGKVRDSDIRNRQGGSDQPFSGSWCNVAKDPTTGTAANLPVLTNLANFAPTDHGGSTA
ncbi:hypothetical protein EJ04DRAFT_530310, partial [Polyplosphaeria fusca]